MVFIGLYTIGYLGAMAAVLPLNWFWGLKLVLLVLIAASLIFIVRSRGMGNIGSLTWKEAGEWLLEFTDGKQLEAQLLPSSFVSPWLVVLNFNAAEENQRLSVTLFWDALDKESFRRLRVRLGVEKTADQ